MEVSARAKISEKEKKTASESSKIYRRGTEAASRRPRVGGFVGAHDWPFSRAPRTPYRRGRVRTGGCARAESCGLSRGNGSTSRWGFHSPRGGASVHHAVVLPFPRGRPTRWRRMGYGPCSSCLATGSGPPPRSILRVPARTRRWGPPTQLRGHCLPFWTRHPPWGTDRVSLGASKGPKS